MNRLIENRFSGIGGEKLARISKARKAEIRSKILDTAFSHFQKRGYEHTSTRDITHEVGIGEGTLYHYFQDKDTLFLEAMVMGFDYVMPEFSQKNNCSSLMDLGVFLSDKLQVFFSFPKDTIRRILIVFLRLHQKDSPVVKRLVLLDYHFLEELKAFFDRWVEQGIMKTCDTWVVSSTVFAILLFEMMNYLFDDQYKQEAITEAIQIKIDFLLKGWMMTSQVH